MNNDERYIAQQMELLFSGVRYVKYRTDAQTGKLNSDSTLNTNVSDGIALPYIWVRFGEDRAAVPVLSKIRPAAGLPVIVALDTLIGEDVVLEVNLARAIPVFGDTATAYNVPSIPAGIFTPTSARDVQPGSVRVDAAGGLVVRIMPTWTPFGAYWDGATQITLVPTATSSKRSFVVLGIDSTGAAVQDLTADRALTYELVDADGNLTPSGAADIQAVVDADLTTWWVGAVLLANGDTSIDGNSIYDRRFWNWPIMTGADGSNAGAAGLVEAPAATDNTKFWRGDGTWAAPSSSGSNPQPSQWVNTTSEGKSGTSFSAYTNSAEGTFVAPPTGMVYVTVSGRLNLGNTVNYAYTGWELREGASIGSGTVVVAADFNRAIRAGNTVTAGAPFYAQGSHRYLVTGLTAGNTYNIRTMHHSSTTVASEFRALLVEPVL